MRNHLAVPFGVLLLIGCSGSGSGPDGGGLDGGSGGGSGSCGHAADCVSGDYCEIPSGSCMGTCKARSAAGTACADVDQCVDGYRCTNSVCTPTSGTVDVGGACSDQSNCRSGLQCDAVTKQCATVIKVGQACVFGHNLCELLTSCGPANTCVQWGTVGSECGVTQQGSLYEIQGCLGGSYCKPQTCSGSTRSAKGTCTAQVADMGVCIMNECYDECARGSCVSGQCREACP